LNHAHPRPQTPPDASLLPAVHGFHSAVRRQYAGVRTAGQPVPLDGMGGTAAGLPRTLRVDLQDRRASESGAGHDPARLSESTSLFAGFGRYPIPARRSTRQNALAAECGQTGRIDLHQSARPSRARVQIRRTVRCRRFQAACLCAVGSVEYLSQNACRKRQARFRLAKEKPAQNPDRLSQEKAGSFRHHQ